MALDESGRLPRTLVPTLYQLTLRPDLQKLTFQGLAVVHLDVAEDDVEVVILNALDLDVKQVSLEGAPGGVKVRSFILDPVTETLRAELDGPLAKGTAGIRLRVDYAGKLNDQMRGFYRTVQRGADGGGSESNAASCHFEASSARMAFPGWDEPTFRAAFEITLEVPDVDDGVVALSNMPEKDGGRKKLDDGYTRVSFRRTPSLSTYLVCWSIGRYDHVKSVTKGGIPVRLFTPVGKSHLGKLGLDVAVKALDYYTEFFGVPYSLPKMDLIAIPDFAIGAMENWGLLTFRESCLLADEETSSATDKQWVALITAHEVAHQWFGNLVTVEWWTHLWLKEGYATWIEFLCVDKVFPAWHIWTQFLTSTAATAKSLDALSNSHPIEVEVKKPADIEEIFDIISYHKGASIIRMLFGWIGEDAFRRGMKSYLQKLAFGNATTADLWRHLSTASGKPVADVMSTWTEKMGFPLVSVKCAKGKEDGQVEVQVTQVHFKAGGASQNGDGEKQRWAIPLTITTKSSPMEPKHSCVLTSDSDSFIVSGVVDGDWLNFNPGGVGFYRVSYPPDLMSAFLPSVADRTLPVDDRLTLLDDQLALSQSGALATDKLMILMEAYREDDDVSVWDCLEVCMHRIKLILRESADDLATFNRWCCWLLEPAMKKVGWEVAKGETHLDSLFRALVVGNLVRCGHRETIREASARFDKHVSSASPDEVVSDLRTAVYKAKLKSSSSSSSDGQKTLDKLIEMAKDSGASTEEKLRLYDALGAAPTADGLQRGLEFAVSKDVRSQDTRSVLGSIARESAEGASLAWKFFTARLDEFKKRYKQGSLLNNAIKAVASGFSTESAAAEIEDFFARNPTPGTDRTVSQILEATRLRAAWAERDRQNIVAYLKKKQLEEE